VLSAALASAYGQNPTGNIQDAHGGATRILEAGSYRVQGSLVRDGSTVRFVLDVQGESSRFEAGSMLVLRQEALVQSRKADGSWSRIRSGWDGLRETHLLPILALQQLPGRFTYDGSRETRDDFSQRIERRTHLGYHARTPRVELAFDRQAGLLAEAFLTTEEGNQSPVEIRYSGYRDFAGLKLPTRVERIAGDTGPWVFQIESIDFSPNFQAGHFDFN
jgi:hypothetical protein